MNDQTKTSERARAKAPNGKSIASQSIASLRILVSPKVTEEQIPARGDKPARTLYGQQAFVKGEDILKSYSHTSFDKEKTLEGGTYILSKDALRLSQYGRLELNPYADLIRVGPMSDDDKARFAVSATDMNDIM